MLIQNRKDQLDHPIGYELEQWLECQSLQLECEQHFQQFESEYQRPPSKCKITFPVVITLALPLGKT